MPEASDRAALGIFGGTFDPVHFGHLRLAEEAADSLGLERVRWIPAGRPALRDSPEVSAEQRLEMVRLAISGNPRFELDSAEVNDARPSYTVPTLERLRTTDEFGPQRPLVLLVGADAFSGMAGWHRWESLFDLAHIAAAAYQQRLSSSPAALQDAPAGRIVTFAMTQLAVSATQIRTLLLNGRSPRYLLPEAVIAYIQSTQLYSKR